MKFDILNMFLGQNTYKVSFNENENTYEIEDELNELGAIIFVDDEKITYYVTNCYDSCADWKDINLEALSNLKNFCEYITRDFEDTKKGD